ncbi:hypothetical protein EGR_10497 [Echinococcus granulosus]|uniref:Uncharacterized protein n=1 Tax=Echinococcus granulosus TaxID=6210 RepID=W6U0J7_ECHGR|nr:hypothetical protein EGR_10497 [Echinococcus granulosus]EUB54645.1 hypothetical protein EGR_10497 [Echinococcus granulosus]
MSNLPNEENKFWHSLYSCINLNKIIDDALQMAGKAHITVICLLLVNIRPTLAVIIGLLANISCEQSVITIILHHFTTEGKQASLQSPLDAMNYVEKTDH